MDAALLHDEQARAAFVAEACGNDVDLLREVESLLAHASEDADFLSTPAAGDGAVGVERAGNSTMLPTTEGLARHRPTRPASRPVSRSDCTGSNVCSGAAAWVKCMRPSTSSTGAGSP